jgi:hypothetical protein
VADDPSAQQGSPTEGAGGVETAVTDTGNAFTPEGRGGTSACTDSFQACGGLLAGEWDVEGTCELAALDRADAERWARGVLALDEAACAGTPQDFTALWSGKLTFRGGLAIDERLRSEAVHLSLTRECLGATLGEAVGDDAELGAACSALSGESTQCSVASGACLCSVRRGVQLDRSGPYGVLEDIRVAYSLSNEPLSRADYCVQADVLHWQEPDTGQHLVLRRRPPALP